MIYAMADGSYARSRARKAVRVGVIETGIDGVPSRTSRRTSTRELSRTFTVDDPTIDGACDARSGRVLRGPGRRRRGRARNARASTIGSPLNGIGIAGVAPKVDLVNLRAGHDRATSSSARASTR